MKIIKKFMEHKNDIPVEYEAMFTDIDIESMRTLLTSAGAACKIPLFKMKRINYFPHSEHKSLATSWIRVRQDDKGEVTLAFKSLSGEGIESQREIETTVGDFDTTCRFLEALECRPKALHESRREQWTLDSVDIMIDEWPHLSPFIEIEASSEESVKECVQTLKLNYDDALFCNVDQLYAQAFGTDPKSVGEIELRFDTLNPFL